MCLLGSALTLSVPPVYLLPVVGSLNGDVLFHLRTRYRFAVMPAACLLAVACGTAGGGSPEPVGAAPTTAEPTPASAAAAEESYTNTIKWKTASELNNFGFDVYRGDSPDGPFERLNPEVIEGAGTTDMAIAYEYVDRTIDPRRTYYYYVESISMDGVRERFTPIGKAPPKIAGDDE